MSLSIYTIPPLFLFISLLVQRFASYLVFEFVVLLAQTMKDQLNVNGCRRWHGILMADIAKLLVI